MATKKKAPPSTPLPLAPTSVRVRPDLHKMAKHFGIEVRKNFTQILNEALDEYLKKHGGA